ncbi:MAG: glycerophosphodiester phosphodiesterase family protein [Planctomycetota bacterium]|nr:glycerophosphodiester phosphodiesterase family protein [Planctomycetota bacterium]
MALVRAKIVAHRGASDVAPENTIPAITKARELGADAVAIEIQGTSDGEPVVLADTKLDRTTNGRGRVARTKLEDIRKLDAGAWFKPEFAGTPVPTLEEAVGAADGIPAIHIHLPEIKAGSRLEDRIVGILARRKPSTGDTLFFRDSESAARLKQKLPAYAAGIILDARADGWLYLAKAGKLGLSVILPASDRMDGKLVADAHAASIAVFAFFADEEKDIRGVLGTGADGFYTHRLERAKAVLAAWARERGSGA